MKNDRVVKTATFNGVVYDIDMSPRINGTCDCPCGGKPSILILADSKTRSELEALIHESLHAEDWSKSEEKVTRIGREVARFLWRLGYRRIEE